MHNLQIYALAKCVAQIRNCEIASQFRIAQPSLRNSEIVLRKLEIVKLCSAISKADVYNNIKRICIFP